MPFVHISDEVEMGRVKWYLVLGVEPRQAELRGICGERTQREQVFFASTGSGGSPFLFLLALIFVLEV